MQTEAVDCDALSTPVFNIDDKGVNRSVISVYMSNEQAYDYTPSTYLPKSMSTRAHACWTVLLVYLK